MTICGLEMRVDASLETTFSLLDLHKALPFRMDDTKPSGKLYGIRSADGTVLKNGSLVFVETECLACLPADKKTQLTRPLFHRFDSPDFFKDASHKFD